MNYTKDHNKTKERLIAELEALRFEIMSLKQQWQDNQPEALINTNETTTKTDTSEPSLVLIVEDDAEVRWLVNEQLSTEYQVVIAADGQEGLEKAIAFQPDLILCDVFMPKMSGSELIHQLRTRSEFDQTPIVVLSGADDIALRGKLLQAGAQDYLSKPFLLAELRVRIGNLLTSQQLREDLQQEVIRQHQNQRILNREIAERKQAEKALRSSERQIRLIADALPVLISYLDTDHCYRFSNQTYEQWFGYDRSEIYGRHLREIIGEKAYKLLRPHIQLCLSGQKVTFEGLVPYNIAGERYVNIAYIPDFGEQQEVKGCIVLVNDLTQRQQYEAALQKLNEELEARVEARTAELVAANQQLQREMIVRQQAETTLRQSEAHFRSLIENASDVITVINRDGIVAYESPAIKRVLGYEPEELVGENAFELVHPEDMSEVIQAFNQLLKDSESVVKVEFRFLHQDNSWRTFSAVGKAVSTDSIVTQVIINSRDVTSRKRAEAALQQSEERFRQIFQDASIGIALADIQTQQIVEANPAYCQLLGYSAAEMCSLTIADLTHPEDLSISSDYLKLFEQGIAENYRIEKRYLKKNGETLWGNLTATVLRDAAGKSCFSLGMIEDITDRKQAEEQIKASLKEKEVMLKEIHHRVKNNLQVVSSLLKLQAGYIKDQKTLDVFRESQNRVRAMALIHEKLYQSKDLAKTDFAGYIRNLAENLFRSYAINRYAIDLQIQVEELRLDIDTAIPCGLIINELISNSLKYAFTPEQTGEVRINLCYDNCDRYVLTVSDNGSGIPEEIDFCNTTSLGLQLVCLLTQQLHGTVELSRDNGTQFTIHFVGAT